MNARGHTSWILTSSLAAIALVYMTMVWLPGKRAMQELRQQVANKQQFVKQAMELSSALICLQREVDQAETITSQWEQKAPGKKDLPALYGKINALAKESQLTTGRFDPQPVLIHHKLREMPVNMTCTGKFEQLYEFLGKLESIPATVWVESLRIGKSAQDDGTVQCELNLVMFSDNS